MSRNINVPTLTAAQAAALGVANLGPARSAVRQHQPVPGIGESWYDGLTLSRCARATPRWGTVRVSYTLSKALDDAGNAFFSTPQDNFDVRAD